MVPAEEGEDVPAVGRCRQNDNENHATGAEITAMMANLLASVILSRRAHTKTYDNGVEYFGGDRDPKMDSNGYTANAPLLPSLP